MADNGEGSSTPPPVWHSRVPEAQPPRVPFPRINPPPMPRPEDVLPDNFEKRPDIYPGSTWRGKRAPFGPKHNLPQYEMNKHCTHGIMVRRFVDDRILCPNCARQPLLGWLLLCVEDLNQPTGPGLSQGISRAMIDGHYTFRERTIVRQQRAIVLQHMEQEYGPAAAPFSRIEVIQGVEPGGEDNDNGNDGLPTEKIDDVRRQNHVESMPCPEQPSRQPRPACRFWCCYHCRDHIPARAFIHLDGFFNDPCTAITLPWELSNRRVSDARVVRNLDNHYKQREHFFGLPTPPYTSSESMSLAIMQPHFMRLCAIASRIDLRSLCDPMEVSEFSSAGLIAELSDSGAAHSFLSGGSRSMLIAYAGENAIEAAEVRSTHERESDLDVEVGDDNYGLESLSRSTTLDIFDLE
ncbi:uncharacterized protein P174DRAFT_52004 [Aspergillus novofumigatus IBT 16806]|uniref:Uncharacterized protein n=1 Tax=Aspergillus novofumigatus (strain IBT 16806) TaxID=1392255 RepID=A0A2I1CPP1_ASPN1|nr:uncharacterized protein P174DRAFT_52004 [Aspergillus novofumigatus IBT 16806]PKX99594.1 hypothetical protein P174DRAFT_52004 [Aspergillus novofumigatus IBT 16806]